MSTYEFLLFAHLLFVVTWVGTDIGLQVLALRAMGAGPERTIAFTADVEWLGTRLLVPSSLLVIVFGILLVNELGYDFGRHWIVLGFVGLRVLVPGRRDFPRPRDRAHRPLRGGAAADDPDVQRRIRRVLSVSRIELVILDRGGAGHGRQARLFDGGSTAA